MSNGQQGAIHSASEGGISATHPDATPFQLFVAPSTADQFNAAQLRLIPLACWKVEDIRFAFDSSFVTPDIAKEIQALRDLREQHKRANSAAGTTQYPPLSIFGHADPVGTDDYNKALSGRRATVIYAVLISNTDPDTAARLWKQVAVAENWGTSQRQTMQAAANLPDGTPSSDLYRAYMETLCPKDLIVSKQDFLAQGADSAGKGDYQGCSEFNPLLIFSQQREQAFDQAEENQDPSGLAARNAANAPNRRVMVLLFRPGSKVDPAKWPCPRATEGVAGCIKRFWSDGQQRRSTRLPDKDREFADTSDTFACRFYQRISDRSPCQQPVPTLEFVLDPKDTHAVDATNPVAAFVRMGLWDHAFTCQPAGTPSSLNNDPAEAKNFVGSDSRRFYLRVADSRAQDNVSVDWRTLKEDSTVLDAPADQRITLIEIGNSTGIFASRALMLVSDKDDQQQKTHSGLAAPLPDAGVRNFGQSNHRMRLADLAGFVEAEYKPASGIPVKVKLPMFNRNPDERRRLSLQIFVLRVAPGGNGVVPTDAGSDLWNVELREIRQIYGRLGIKVETVVAPGTPAADIVTVAGDSIVLIDAPQGINPLSVSFNPLNGANDESRLGQAFPALADTIRVFYAGGLASGNRAESWTDVDFGALPQKGACFANRVAATYNVAHEMGHILTNKPVAQHNGHYLAPAGDPGKRLCTDQNLMKNGTSVVEGVLESKRLWDEGDADGVRQVTSILGSHYTHAF